MTTNTRADLIAAYRSGQIEEWAWQEHLAADPELRAMVEPVAVHVMTDMVEYEPERVPRS